MKHKFIALMALVLVVGGLVALTLASNDHQKPSTKTAGNAVSTNQVTIKNYMFEPMTFTVKVGTKVTWLNQDAVQHTITADSASSDAPSSMDIAQGKSFSFTFNKVGTYTYHCFPHPYMHGTVKVTE